MFNYFRRWKHDGKYVIASPDYDATAPQLDNDVLSKRICTFNTYADAVNFIASAFRQREDEYSEPYIIFRLHNYKGRLSLQEGSIGRVHFTHKNGMRHLFVDQYPIEWGETKQPIEIQERRKKFVN